MAGFLGGLLGGGSTQPTRIAELMNPANARKYQFSRGLMSAGAALMNPDPHAPPSFGASIGRMAQGAAQGAEEGRQRFYDDGMRNIQLSEMQRGFDERDQKKAALDQFMQSPEFQALDPTMQSFVKVNPELGLATWAKAKLEGGANDWQEVSLEDGVYAVSKSDPTKKMRIGERANLNEGEGRDFKQSRDLRTDYTKASEPFEKKRIAYQNIVAAYEGANKNPDNPGPADIALIFSFMKMLDPSSTVMQGEYANAQNAGSVDQRLIAQYNSLIDGGKLAPGVRDAFIEQATAQYKSQLATYGNTRSTYQDLARQRNLNPDEVAPDYTYGVTPFEIKKRQLKTKYGLE